MKYFSSTNIGEKTEFLSEKKQKQINIAMSYDEE